MNQLQRLWYDKYVKEYVTKNMSEVPAPENQLSSSSPLKSVPTSKKNLYKIKLFPIIAKVVSLPTELTQINIHDEVLN